MAGIIGANIVVVLPSYGSTNVHSFKNKFDLNPNRRPEE